MHNGLQTSGKERQRAHGWRTSTGVKRSVSPHNMSTFWLISPSKSSGLGPGGPVSTETKTAKAFGSSAAQRPYV